MINTIVRKTFCFIAGMVFAGMIVAVAGKSHAQSLFELDGNNHGAVYDLTPQTKSTNCSWPAMDPTPIGMAFNNHNTLFVGSVNGTIFEISNGVPVFYAQLASLQFTYGLAFGRSNILFVA